MTKPTVLVEADGPVRVITINRPERKNALDLATWDSLRDAFDDVRSDATVGAAVLTGAGDAFCAGVDLTDFSNPDAYRDADRETQGYAGTMRALIEFDVPLIAAVNGAGVGFGMTVLGLCDLVLMSETARVKVPFVDMGVTTEGAASMLLPLRVGWQEAARITMTGDWVGAQECVDIGLAWKVVPGDELMDEATALAQRIAGTSVDSVRTTKRLMMEHRTDAVRATVAREQAEFARMLSSMRGA